MLLSLRIDTVDPSTDTTTATWCMDIPEQDSAPSIGTGVQVETGDKGIVLRVKDVIMDYGARTVAQVWLEPIEHSQETLRLLRHYGFGDTCPT